MTPILIASIHAIVTQKGGRTSRPPLIKLIFIDLKYFVSLKAHMVIEREYRPLLHYSST